MTMMCCLASTESTLTLRHLVRQCGGALCLSGRWACAVSHRDSDIEDRNFSPVFLEGGGVVDLAITAMDQGWCMQAYTCQKRLRCAALGSLKAAVVSLQKLTC